MKGRCDQRSGPSCMYRKAASSRSNVLLGAGGVSDVVLNYGNIYLCHGAFYRVLIAAFFFKIKAAQKLA